MTIQLTPEAVEAYKTIMENPADYAFSFRPLKECFEKPEEATPKHILFNEYVEYLNLNLPKVFFYIIMDELYPQAKAASGEFGYKVKFKPITA